MTREAKRRVMAVGSLGLAATLAIMGIVAAQLNPQPDAPKKKASPKAVQLGDEARRAVGEHINELTAEEVFRCCIAPVCAFCSTSADHCPCAANLAQGKGVCPECKGGWIAGRGNLPGVAPGKDAENVKMLSRDEMKMMFDMKEKNFDQAMRSNESEEPAPKKPSGPPDQAEAPPVD